MLLGKNLALKIENNCYLGMSFKGFFDDRDIGRVGSLHSSKPLGRLDALPEYTRKNRINIVYIALPMMQEERILRVLDELKDTTASI